MSTLYTVCGSLMLFSQSIRVLADPVHWIDPVTIACWVAMAMYWQHEANQ